MERDERVRMSTDSSQSLNGQRIRPDGAETEDGEAERSVRARFDGDWLAWERDQRSAKRRSEMRGEAVRCGGESESEVVGCCRAVAGRCGAERGERQTADGRRQTSQAADQARGRARCILADAVQRQPSCSSERALSLSGAVPSGNFGPLDISSAWFSSLPATSVPL
ncbi:hypothetical protein L1887_55087 [Cichorium endivia]|nr:hypothetical protein L1887_55087 [Cichorium endivia]